jgi:hypothetical protein
LDYGWAWCRGAGRNETTKSPESLKLEGNEQLQAMFHQSIPWLLFYVGIPVITKELIPAILGRMRVLDAIGPKLFPQLDINEELLENFVGFSTNVSWKSDAEFWKTVHAGVPRITKSTESLARKVIAGLVESRASCVLRQIA